MNAELKRQLDGTKLFCALGASESLAGNVGADCVAQLSSSYTPDASHLDTWAVLFLESALAPVTGNPLSTARVRAIPNGSGGFLIDQTVSVASFLTSQNCELVVNYPRWYRVAAGWDLVWTSIDVYLNGVNVLHYTATTSWSGLMGTPAAYPLLTDPTLSGYGNINEAPTLGPLSGGLVTSPPATYSKTSTVNASGSGGYQIMEPGSGVWTSLPLDYIGRITDIGGCGDCAIDSDNLPTQGAADSGSLSFTAGNILTDSVVYGGEVKCSSCTTGDANIPATLDYWYWTVDWHTWDANATALPNLPKSIKRMSHALSAHMPDDFGMAVRRCGLPQTQIQTINVCEDFITETITDSSTYSVIHPRLPKGAGHFLSDPHVLESCLTLPTPCPFGWSANHYSAETTFFQVVAPGTCPLGGSFIYTDCVPVINRACYHQTGQVFPAIVDDDGVYTGNPDLDDAPGLYHPDQSARYVNYWSSPAWCFRPRYPASSDSGAAAWLILGVAADPFYSWQKWKMQQAKDPRMSSGDASLALMDVISPPLRNGALSGFWAGFYADGCSVGSCIGGDAWKAVIPTIPTSYTPTSATSARWSAVGATLAFGASITVTPGAAGTVTVDYVLDDFGTDPRMLLALLKSVVAAWTGGTITAASIEVIGQDGSAAVLGSAPGTYGWPSARPATKHAISGEQNYGDGFAGIADTGVAAGPDAGNDVSAASLADTILNEAFQLLPGFSAKLLRFSFTVTSTAAITLSYPKFNLFTGAKAIPENPFVTIVIYDNGPALRLGEHRWWDATGTGWLEPPVIRGFGYDATQGQYSSLDGLADMEATFQGRDPNAVIDADIAGIWDSVEQGGRGDVATGTNAYWVAAQGAAGAAVPTLACVNGYETPPLAQLPHKARGSDLKETGAYALEAWAHAQESRCYVASGASLLKLVDGGGLNWLSPASFSVLGYSIAKHDRPTTGSEGDLFQLQNGASVEIATMSPRHGLLSIYATGGTTTGLAYDVTLPRLHARALLRNSDGHLLIEIASNEPQPLSWTDTDTGLTGIDAAKLQWLRYGDSATLGVFYRDSGGLHYMQTSDGGRHFTTPMTIDSGSTYWALDFVDSPRGKWFYWLESDGTIYLEILDNYLNVVMAKTATNLTGVSNAPISARQSLRTGNEFRIGMLFTNGSGAQHMMAGIDGLTFS